MLLKKAQGNKVAIVQTYSNGIATKNKDNINDAT